MNDLGKGKMSSSQSNEDLGLIDREKCDNKQKLRAENNEMQQRPVATTKKLKSDRGTFDDKC